MERELKLLYRQRGSALRRVDQTVVIRDNATEDDNASADADMDLGEDVNAGVGLDVDEHYMDVEQNADEASSAGTAGFVNVAAAATNDNNIADERIISENPENFVNASYSFDGLPVTKLSTSITSMAAIEVIQSIVDDIFKKVLVPQSKQRFHESRSRKDRLSYKMDLKLFEQFLSLVKSDLKDIQDIHFSNNEMCYQMKQILKVKQDLTEEIVKIRDELAEYDVVQSEDAKKVEELESLIELNNKLKSLKDIETDLS
ncbi:Ame1p Ecym_3083 [Eremothecium cymbalariae DBVPG|uniref:Inner kinetochore subunit AME1 domain-containing protein n=1 Tax=Eremothecium cymbalariae (strain CBS 270.75 / DBVPG 7215 / KCTC 17166 / NRRL Y-17582) TaxID=931890 RepID=G8JR26_ERECY|nr:Hypothetical protein Ecym_3083 [Eremothecium cymbalariae DBVPG\